MKKAKKATNANSATTASSAVNGDPRVSSAIGRTADRPRKLREVTHLLFPEMESGRRRRRHPCAACRPGWRCRVCAELANKGWFLSGHCRLPQRMGRDGGATEPDLPDPPGSLS